MNNQEDILQSNRKENVESEFQKIAPLVIDKPEGPNEGVQSVTHKISPNFFESVLLSIRDYISNYISLADTKAGILIGVYSGLLSLGVLKAIKNVQIHFNQWGISEYLTIGSWIFLLAALVLSVLVVWPKIASSKKEGFVSWPHISRYNDVDDYLKNILSTNEDEIVSQICILNYDLSQVCKRKYLFLSWAFKLGIVGTVVLLSLLLKTLMV